VVSVLLLGVAALASLVPARSSTRIDAVIALRAEG
jgi:ABC-type lipoprotein release transport system permease subunit